MLLCFKEMQDKEFLGDFGIGVQRLLVLGFCMLLRSMSIGGRGDLIITILSLCNELPDYKSGSVEKINYSKIFPLTYILVIYVPSEFLKFHLPCLLPSE